jgi:hypothetical protein
MLFSTEPFRRARRRSATVISSFSANPWNMLYAATSPKGSPSKAFEASRSASDKCPEAGTWHCPRQRSEFAQMLCGPTGIPPSL